MIPVCRKCGTTLKKGPKGNWRECFVKQGSKICSSCNILHVRAYRAANPAKVIAASRVNNAKWRAANRDKANEATKVWRNANPERVRENNARNYAERKAAKEAAKDKND